MIRTVPLRPHLDPQKALGWVLGYEPNDWQSISSCPRCHSTSAFLRTFLNHDGNVWFSCSRCGAWSFYEELVRMGVTEFSEFQSITRDCGGGEIDGDWLCRVDPFLRLQKTFEARGQWNYLQDVRFKLSSKEASAVWSGFLNDPIQVNGTDAIYARPRFNVLKRLAGLDAFWDKSLRKRFVRLPELNFDDLGPTFSMDRKTETWGDHLVISNNWDPIDNWCQKSRGVIKMRGLAPLRITNAPSSPLLLTPRPIRWITLLDQGNPSVLALASSFPPETLLSTLSGSTRARPDRSVQTSVASLKGKPRSLLMALAATSNGPHAHPCTRNLLHKFVSQ